MGFHIVNLTNNTISHEYVENEFDIIYLKNLTENTIIYQGEKHWKPVRLGNANKYKNYSKAWFRAGLKAQELFKKQAKEERFMLEELFQDETSFKQYLIKDEYFPIKRGDFLVRNHGNIEIDIKCRRFYIDEKSGNTVFNFKCEDVIRHLNMQKLTNTPILIAVYERDFDNVIETIPYFLSIERTNFEKLNKVYIRSENTGYCYQIPINKTEQSFDFIKYYQDTYSVDETRRL